MTCLNNGAVVCGGLLLLVTLAVRGINALARWRQAERTVAENEALARSLVKREPEIEWERPLFPARPLRTIHLDQMTPEQFREALEALDGEPRA